LVALGDVLPLVSALLLSNVDAFTNPVLIQINGRMPACKF